MLNRIESIYVGIGLALRVFLFCQTKIRNYFENSGEFVTPLNSWKRGIHLLAKGESMIIYYVFFSYRRNWSTKT